jgi:hypothetical protein
MSIKSTSIVEIGMFTCGQSERALSPGPKHRHRMPMAAAFTFSGQSPSEHIRRTDRDPVLICTLSDGRARIDSPHATKATAFSQALTRDTWRWHHPAEPGRARRVFGGHRAARL